MLTRGLRARSLTHGMSELHQDSMRADVLGISHILSMGAKLEGESGRSCPELVPRTTSKG